MRIGRKRGIGSGLGLLTTVLVAATAVADGSPGDATAEHALALCKRVDLDTDPDATLARALRLAEDAVAADARSARAHLAVFCSIGKELERSGLGLRTLGKLRRLGQEIDRAFELAPGDPEILASRGAYLATLPRALGGDPAEGERLLRQAVLADPDNVDARRYLARVVASRGGDEAAASL